MQTLVIWLHPYTLISGALFLNEGVTLSSGLITGNFYLKWILDFENWRYWLYVYFSVQR